MKTREEVQKIAEQFAEVVRKEIDSEAKIYLFGSYVNGTPTEDSDIDIAIISDTFGENFIEDGARMMVLSSEIDLDIEPHTLTYVEYNDDSCFYKSINEGVRL